MKKNPMHGRSPALKKAQAKYNDKLQASGRRRLPGSFIPEDMDAILQSIQEREDCGLAPALWLCVKFYEKNIE